MKIDLRRCLKPMLSFTLFVGATLQSVKLEDAAVGFGAESCVEYICQRVWDC